MQSILLRIWGHTILCIILLLSRTATAEFSLEGLTDLRGRQSGQTVAAFLTLPASASILAHNMIATTGTSDASDIYFAPANTAFFTRHRFGFSHLEWLMGLRKEFVAAGFSLLDIGTIGIYSQVFSLGDFNHARTIDETISHPQAVEYTVGGSFGRVLIPYTLATGVHVSFLESRLDEEIARSLTADLDFIFKPHHWITSRLYMKHLGTAMKYSEKREPLPFTLGLAASFSPTPYSQPPFADTIKPNYINFSLSAGFRKQVDEPLTAAGGFKIGVGPYLQLLGGYEHSYGRELSVEGLSAGISLDYQKYGVDAGWKYQSHEFGPVWAVSVRYQTDELIPKNANDYYLIARKHFEKKLYRMAIRYAKKALGINPNFWQAHQLITETISLLRREKGVEIGLIYAGNIQGRFISNAGSDMTLGGLSRVATVVKKLKGDYSQSVAIETGNLIGSNEHPIKITTADVYLREVGFDAHALGAHEQSYGIEKYGAATAGSDAVFTCTNCNSFDSKNLVETSIVSTGKYRVAVLSIIGGSADFAMHDGVKALQRQLHLPAVSSCDLRVAVIHDTWERLAGYLGSVQGLDFAICGGIDEKFDVPMKIGGTVVLSPGAYGQHVGLLSLRFDSGKNLLGFTNRLVPVTTDIKPSERVEKAVQTYVAQMQLREEGLSHLVSGEGDTLGIFPFISDRHGRPHVFLKVLRKHADFPLTGGKLSYGKPVLNLAKGLIACVSGIQKDCTVVMMDISGANKRVLPLKNVSDITFGPDGNYLYMATNSDSGASLHRMAVEGSDVSLLCTRPRSTINNISFSSEGLLSFTARNEDRSHIFISDTSSWNPIQLTDARADHVNPQFSENGRYLSWLSDQYSFGGRKDLWVHDLHTGNTLPLTRRTAVSSHYWLDNRTIIYASGETLQSLHVVDIFSRKSAPFISSNRPKQYHEHSPRLLYTEHGTKIMYVREDLDGNRQVYWSSLDGSDDQRLTSSAGSDWLE